MTLWLYGLSAVNHISEMVPRDTNTPGAFLNLRETNRLPQEVQTDG